MLKAIIFDFDGVLVDSERPHYLAFLAVAQTLGITFSWQDYLDRFIGFDDRDVFRVLLGRPPGNDPAEDKAQLATLCDRKAQQFERIVNQEIHAVPGATELVRAALTQRWPIAIASGATRQDIDLILDKINLAGCFEVIVTADDVPRSKPDPTSYAMAVEQLAHQHPAMKLLPRDCLAIEDTAAGVESARGAGLWTLGLTSTGPADVLYRAHRVVTTLENLTLEQLRSWFGP